MKKNMKKGVCYIMLLLVGFAQFVQAESIKLPIETVSRNSEAITYNLTIPEGENPLVVWRSSNLKDWSFLTHTEVGENLFLLKIHGPQSFIQGFPRGYDPNDPDSECPIIFHRTLISGSTGFDVVELQDFLIQYRGLLTLPEGVPKGFFGQLTESALADYQRENGLPASRYLDQATRDFIREYVCLNPTPKIRDESGGDPLATVFQVEDDQTSGRYKIGEFEIVVPLGFSDWSSQNIFVVVDTGNLPFGVVINDFEIEIDGKEFDGLHHVVMELGGVTYGPDSGRALIEIETGIHFTAGSIHRGGIWAEFEPAQSGNYQNGQEVFCEIPEAVSRLWGFLNSDNEPVSIDGYYKSETHTLMDEGAFFSLRNTSASRLFIPTPFAAFRIDLDIAAFGDDIYLSQNASQTIGFSIVNSATGLPVYDNHDEVSQDVPYYIDMPGQFPAEKFRIDEGDEETLVFIAYHEPSSPGAYYLRIDYIDYEIGMHTEVTRHHFNNRVYQTPSVVMP